MFKREHPRFAFTQPLISPKHNPLNQIIFGTSESHRPIKALTIGV